MNDEFELFKFKTHASNKFCDVWAVAAVVGGAAVVSSLVNAYTTSKAVSAQTSAIDKANAQQKAQYEQTRSDLATYRNLGDTASQEMTNKLADFTTPITMDQATLEATPGYQFALAQGLKAAKNSAINRGLGVSGAQLKGQVAFATGLADPREVAREP